MEKINNIEELLLIILLICLALLSILLIGFVKQLNDMSNKLIAEKTGKKYEPFSLTNWINKQSGLEVPVNKENEILLEHDYDGIKELDNHLPPWWLNLFFATIVFSIGYLLIYHVYKKAPLQDEEYQIAVDKAAKEQGANQAAKGNSIDENNLTDEQKDPAALENGKKVFDTNCIACHGQAGEGGVGPNLTDDFWLHGGSLKDIFTTIKYGVPDKGMISWQASIKPKDMEDVSNYIVSLHGTNPPNAKAAEGKKYVPGAETPADSTKASK